MPIGYLMDRWECHKQFIGISKPRREYFIDDVIPEWIQMSYSFVNIQLNTNQYDYIINKNKKS